MQRSYTVITFDCNEKASDILIAALSQIGFNSFMLSDYGFQTSIESEYFRQEVINDLLGKFSLKEKVRFTVEKITEQNWNRQWERSYHPIIIDNKCRIRASFHKPEDTHMLDLVIEPKMSFGTGHHDTTYLMIQNQLQIDHRNKKVLDAGCGTGVLSILAEKLGADHVTGFDIDPWAYENSIENLEANDCHKISIIKGTVHDVPKSGRFELILANINLNVILNDFNEYHNLLHPGGMIVLSGFLNENFAEIQRIANEKGYELEKKAARNNWLSLIYIAPQN